MGIKERILNTRIKIAEKKFLAKEKNEKYNFFGYISEDCVPAFVTEGRTSKTEDGNSVHFANFVYAFTPQTLKFCVCNLTDEAKSDLAQNIDEFKKMCNEVANYSVYQSESWEEQIESLSSYLQSYNQNQNE